MKKAANIIDSGLAIDKLKDWVREQNQNPDTKLNDLENMLAMADA
jgi:hypothetical protein